MVRIVHVDAAGLAPYAEGLRALERSIEYPIGESDFFRIDHGAQYHPFFSTLGEAHFLVALEGDSVIGGVAAVLRKARWGSTELTTAYAADLKVVPSHRGGRLVPRMLFFGLREILRPRNGRFRSWRFLFGAAMKGDKGDLMRSAKGVTPLKLVQPSAALQLYFVPPEKLASLDTRGAPGVHDQGLDLSPEPVGVDDGYCSTHGRKDLRLRSTGEPWPLIFCPLGPKAWIPSHADYLARAGRAIVGRGLPGPVCFGLDRRLSPHVDWLERQGISPGAQCTIYSIRRSPVPRVLPWVHLAASEI